MASRLRLEISQSAIARNMDVIRHRAGQCRILAVIKANAYGLGALKMGAYLKTQGVSCFGAATLDEALELLPLGMPVQILGALLPEETAPAVKAGLRCPVDSFATAERISREAVRQGKTADCDIAVDTGMGRLGILADGSAAEEIRRIAALPNLALNGLFSHFSSAGEADGAYSKLQLERFLKLYKELNMPFTRVHHAASEGILMVDRAMEPPFTQVRAGLGMYANALTLKARIGAVRHMPAGSFLSYSRTCKLAKDTVVGVVCAGYADGIPQILSNKGEMIVKGKRCAILGRVCMDYTLLDLSGVPDVQTGDEVVCFAPGENAVTPEQWGVWKGTHLHDILCAISPRVERAWLP
ncbi:MAG: alanine racemase [Lentisphaeria bacterium]|nr:alanine racemase [Lentisphaeria bacterium]